MYSVSIHKGSEAQVHDEGSWADPDTISEILIPKFPELLLGEILPSTFSLSPLGRFTVCISDYRSWKNPVTSYTVLPNTFQTHVQNLYLFVGQVLAPLRESLTCKSLAFAGFLPETPHSSLHGSDHFPNSYGITLRFKLKIFHHFSLQTSVILLTTFPLPTVHAAPTCIIYFLSTPATPTAVVTNAQSGNDVCWRTVTSSLHTETWPHYPPSNSFVPRSSSRSSSPWILPPQRTRPGS